MFATVRSEMFAAPLSPAEPTAPVPHGRAREAAGPPPTGGTGPPAFR